MSTLFCHVGQCGNQLATPFWTALTLLNTEEDQNSLNKPSLPFGFASSFVKESPSPKQFAKPPKQKNKTKTSLRNDFDSTPRALFIDSEPQVVKQLLMNPPPRLALSTTQTVVTGMGGMGNVFAAGYSGVAPHTEVSDSSTLVEDALNAIRQQAEAADGVDGILLMHALAGGTGSGLSARLLEELSNDNYGTLGTVSVLPFETGDTALQALNSALSLSWVHQFADVAFLASNASLAAQVRALTENNRDTVSTQCMNELLGSQLGLLFAAPLFSGRRLGRLALDLTPLPSCRFVQLFGVTDMFKPGGGNGFSSSSATSFLHGVKRTHKSTLAALSALAPSMEATSAAKSLAATAYTTSPIPESNLDWARYSRLFAGTNDKSSYVLPVQPTGFSYPNTKRFSSVVAANARCAGTIALQTAKDCDEKVKAHSFTHHFADFGFDDVSFADAIDSLYNIHNAYETLLT